MTQRPRLSWPADPNKLYTVMHFDSGKKRGFYSFFFLLEESSRAGSNFCFRVNEDYSRGSRRSSSDLDVRGWEVSSSREAPAIPHVGRYKHPGQQRSPGQRDLRVPRSSCHRARRERVQQGLLSTRISVPCIWTTRKGEFVITRIKRFYCNLLQIVMEESSRGCGPELLGRVQRYNELAEKYNLKLVAGNFVR